MWKLNDTLLNYQWSKKDITREINIYVEIKVNEDTITNLIGCS